MRIDTVRKTFTSWAPYYDATHAWALPYCGRTRLALRVQPSGRVRDLPCAPD